MLEDYTVFDNKKEMAKANGRYLFELYKEGNILEDRHLRSNPSECVFFDMGKELKDGRIACQVPTKHIEKVGGKKEKLDKDKFKVVSI